jgi:phage FluMu gp28-like protein
VISKGGRVRLGSSPFGSRGVFWEVFTESMRRYPDYTRKKTPWWEIFSFCTDVPDAVRNAPMLPTAERVERYGKTRVRTIYDNMTLEDFQQEYECHFGAESLTLLSWETVLGMQDDALDCAQVRITGNDVLPAIDAIDRVAHKVKTGVIEQAFFLGLDVGRTKDATEIMLVGASDSSSSLPLRLSVTLINTEFDRQFDVLRSLLKRLPVTFGMLDRTGIGYYLAERTTGEFPEQVIGVDFTNLSKRTWATYLKTQAERGNITIPTDRELAYQLHSVKRIVTPDKNLKFDNAPTDKHHADKFWALALALAAYRSGQNEYVSSSTTYA